MTSTTQPLTTPLAPARLRAPRKRRLGWWFLFVGLLAVASVAHPRVFSLVVGQVIRLETWRHGGQVHLGRVDGGWRQPIVLHHAHWTYRSSTGSLLRVEVARMEADLRWGQLFHEGGGRWFQRLSLIGVTGKMELPETPSPSQRGGSLLGGLSPAKRWWRFPERIDVAAKDFLITVRGDSVRLRNSRWTASELEPGVVEIGQLAVKQPWLTRTFREVRGTTALSGTRVVLANVVLESGVEIRSLSAQMGDLARGRLNMVGELAAFGGTVRGDAQTMPGARGLEVEANGSFAQIEVAPLAAFLGRPEAAGGTIREGKGTFRGSPRSPAGATGSLRLAATNFQWEARQWDSLVLGGTLLDGRVQVPEFELKQGQNRLSLNGEVTIPIDGAPWWKTGFTVTIAAKIHNLTELSSLLLPEFKYAAGRGSIDGTVRGEGGQFTGAIIAEGNNLTWRNAPVEELHAALKLAGNELHLLRCDLSNGADMVRGRGVVNIVGAKQYWGEVRASVQELGTYAALLGPPISPEPLAGGGVLDWSGEGSARGHSGKFSARLKQVRSRGRTGDLLHPLNAEMVGTYAPGALQFSRFALSDEQSSFSANVSVGPKTLHLAGLRLQNGTETWLEGDAVLPLDLWRAWPNTALPALLTDGVPCWLRVTARGLRLREGSRLTGMKWPLGGIVDGYLHAEGNLGSLNTDGRITLRDGELPLGWSGNGLTGVQATFAASGQKLAVESFVGQHASGTYETTGAIDFANLRDAWLDLRVMSKAAVAPLWGGAVSVTSALDLGIVGPASEATVSGIASAATVHLGAGLDVRRLWTKSFVGSVPPLWELQAQPWAAWKLDVRTAAEMEADLGYGKDGPNVPFSACLKPAISLTGTGGNPGLVGNVEITEGDMRVRDHAASPAEDVPASFKGTISVMPGTANCPVLDIAVTGSLEGCTFGAAIVGSLAKPLRVYETNPPLTAEVVRAALAEEPWAVDEIFTLRVPAEQRHGVEEFPWAIAAMPPEE